MVDDAPLPVVHHLDERSRSRPASELLEEVLRERDDAPADAARMTAADFLARVTRIAP